MTLIELIEVMYPALNGKIEVGKPFPCPLAMHMPSDERPMFITVDEYGQRWRCDGGCAGDDWKNAVQFIANAMGMVPLDAFELWSELDDLDSQQDRVYLIAAEYPYWYPEEVEL